MNRQSWSRNILLPIVLWTMTLFVFNLPKNAMAAITTIEFSGIVGTQAFSGTTVGDSYTVIFEFDTDWDIDGPQQLGDWLVFEWSNIGEIGAGPTQKPSVQISINGGSFQPLSMGNAQSSSTTFAGMTASIQLSTTQCGQFLINYNFSWFGDLASEQVFFDTDTGITRFNWSHESVSGTTFILDETDVTAPCKTSGEILAEGLIRAASQRLAQGTLYKSPSTLIPGGLGQTGEGTAEWDIKFPGVRDKKSGALLATDPNDLAKVVGQNYFESEVLAAADLYRQALFWLPTSLNAVKGLLQTYYERMAPLIYAGNNGQVWVFLQRISGTTLADELIRIDESLVFYQKAIDVFIELTQSNTDLPYFNGTSSDIVHGTLRSPITGANQAIVPLILSAYLRAVASQVESVQERIEKAYINAYSFPVLPVELAPGRAAVVDYIDQMTGRIQMELVLADAYMDIFSGMASVIVTDVGRAEQGVTDLLSRRDDIVDGLISFSGALDQSTNPFVGGSPVYPPEFVPFLKKDPTNNLLQNSYDNLYASAETAVMTIAKPAEDSALLETRAFDNDKAQLETRLAEVRERAFAEMGDLCGWVFDPNFQAGTQIGALVPDIVLCPLPVTERTFQHNYNSSIGETAAGAVGRQWATISLAETELEAASLDLSNLQERMRKRASTATREAAGAENLAVLHLTTGEQLAALEVAQGEVQAGLELTLHRLSQQNSFLGGFFKTVFTVVGIVAAPFDAGATAAALSAIGTTWNNIAAAPAANNAAEARARSHRQLADIEKQKQLIRAYESAQVQFQHRTAILLKLEEEIHGMLLDAARLKLNVLMAVQRLDMENAELSRLLSRAGFLYQQWHRNNELALNAPINRPEYRLIRDLKLRDADSTFLYAQKRCYLAAKAAEYRVNPDPAINNLKGVVETIVKARRVTELQAALVGMNSVVENLYLGQGNADTGRLTLSVRNFLVQNNFILEDINGDPILAQSLFGNGDQVTSDADWLLFLQDHYVIDTVLGISKLVIPFTTSLNRPNAVAQATVPNQPALGIQQRRFNPLHIPTGRGMLISWTGGGASQHNGVTINIRGRALQLPPNVDVVTQLEQRGTSAVRYATWDADQLGTGHSVRYWNLEPVTADIITAINGTFQQTTFGDQFRPDSPEYHERSPANSRWVLTIRDDFGGGANASLLSQLDRITDIVLTFDVTYFTPTTGVAAQPADAL